VIGRTKIADLLLMTKSRAKNFAVSKKTSIFAASFGVLSPMQNNN
jgi:hypothetical protein